MKKKKMIKKNIKKTRQIIITLLKKIMENLIVKDGTKTIELYPIKIIALFQY